jgi:hypothetical protein
MKYVTIGKLDHIPEERSWEYDVFGNRVDKETGEFVVLVEAHQELYKEPPMTISLVGNEWKPKQMEFEFG